MISLKATARGEQLFQVHFTDGTPIPIVEAKDIGEVELLSPTIDAAQIPCFGGRVADQLLFDLMAYSAYCALEGEDLSLVDHIAMCSRRENIRKVQRLVFDLLE